MAGGNEDAADETVTAGLVEYEVSVSSASVAESNIEFAAINESASEVHELAVLKIGDDGPKEVVGEIEDIPAGVSATIKLHLQAGT